MIKYPGIKRKAEKLERERMKRIHEEPSFTELAWCAMNGIKPK
jgi:hypothetical protein